MTVSQAIGLCSTLTILEPDPVYYDEQFSTILLELIRISPVIEPVELGRVYIGVDGLDRLMGSATKQIQAIAAVVGADIATDKTLHGKRRWGRNRILANGSRLFARRTGLSLVTDDGQHGNGIQEGVEWKGVRLGWARGKFAAWVAACKSKPDQPFILREEERHTFLGAQSVAVLPIERDTHRRLWQLGIKTLTDLAALPVEAVVSQFGHEGRVAWRFASGAVVEPVVGKPPPENIVTHIEFPLPVADRSILNYAIGKLLERAVRDPRRVGWRVHSVRVHAQLEQNSSWLTEVTLKEPSAEPQHICAPLAVKLEQSPPTGAVESITVEITSLVRGTAELQLFARDSTSAARAGRHRALRWASKEIQKRLRRSMLHNVIEVHPWSRLPERRYALIDYDP